MLKKVVELKELEYKNNKIVLMTTEQYVAIKTEELAQKGIVYQPRINKRSNESSNMKNPKKQKKEEPKSEPNPEDLIQKGMLIEVKNVPTDIPHSDFKAYFARFGNVQFVDVTKIAQQLITVRFIDCAATQAAYGEISEKKNGDKG